jgi:hypothetical protein
MHELTKRVQRVNGRKGRKPFVNLASPPTRFIAPVASMSCFALITLRAGGLPIP